VLNLAGLDFQREFRTRLSSTLCRLGVYRAADAANTLRWLEKRALANADTAGDRQDSKIGSETITEKTDSEPTHATMELSLDLQTQQLMMKHGGGSSLDSYSKQRHNEDWARFPMERDNRRITNG